MNSMYFLCVLIDNIAVELLKKTTPWFRRFKFGSFSRSHWDWQKKAILWQAFIQSVLKVWIDFTSLHHTSLPNCWCKDKLVAAKLSLCEFFFHPTVIIHLCFTLLSPHVVTPNCPYYITLSILWLNLLSYDFGVYLMNKDFVLGKDLSLSIPLLFLSPPPPASFLLLHFSSLAPLSSQRQPSYRPKPCQHDFCWPSSCQVLLPTPTFLL